jgi:pimeloyl-ACP methyl ester carboxylesterase
MADVSVAQESPRWRWTYLEAGRTAAEIALLPIMRQFLNQAPEGDGHAVMVLPGFMAGDSSTGTMRRFLSSRGYETYPWELGRNLGMSAIGDEGEHLAQRLEDLYHDHGQKKVSLVGWSLGGVMAREVAKTHGHMVRQVISLGSPFGGLPEKSRAWPLYKFLAQDEVETDEFLELVGQLAEPPEVPTTSIYTKTDGVVHWKSSIEKEAHHTDNIEVRTAHCGLGFNAPTMYAVADRLAQPEGTWKRFHREGWRGLVYPSSGH